MDCSWIYLQVCFTKMLILNVIVLILDYQVRQEERWDQRCLGIEGMLRHNLLSYTIQPVPYPGRVEFSAAFLSRERIIQDRVALGTL